MVATRIQNPKTHNVLLFVLPTNRRFEKNRTGSTKM